METLWIKKIAETKGDGALMQYVKAMEAESFLHYTSVYNAEHDLWNTTGKKVRDLVKVMKNERKLGARCLHQAHIAWKLVKHPTHIDQMYNPGTVNIIEDARKSVFGR